MRLGRLADELGAGLFAGASADPEIERVVASDRISEILTEASERTLVVTSLSGASLVRAAHLVDVPAICLVNGARPEPDLVRAAAESGVALLVSPFTWSETCGRVGALLGQTAARRNG